MHLVTVGPVRLRTYRASDLDRLHLIDLECFPPGIAYSRADLARFIQHQHSRTWVAEVGEGQIVGFLVAGREPYRVGHIITIDVTGEYRRQGVGIALMDAAEEWSSRQSLRLIYLETAEDNEPAQKFYQKLGYEKHRVIERYYDDGTAAWVMVKWLKQKPVSRTFPKASRRKS